MMYIFIPSYPSIYFAIYKALNNKDVTIVTNNRNVAKILKEIKINFLLMDFEFDIKKIMSTKIKINDFFLTLDKTKDFYLLDNIFCVEGFYLANRWPKGKVYYKNLSAEFNFFEGKLSFKSKVLKYLYRLVFNLKLSFRNVNGKPITAIDQKFIKNNEFNLLQVESYKSIKLDVLKKIKLKTNSYNSIFVLQGDLRNILKENSLSKIFEELKTIQSLVIKEHPKHKTTVFFNELPKLPNYYPVEMCYGNINKNIIAIYSLSLVLASEFPHLKAISLLEMVTWFSDEYKNHMKNELIAKSNNKIFFPTNSAELLKLLNN